MLLEPELEGKGWGGVEAVEGAGSRGHKVGDREGGVCVCGGGMGGV